MSSLLNESTYLPFPSRQLRILAWNTRSICIKRIELDTLISQIILDLITVSESWLTPEYPSWEVKNYITIRCDRLHGRGGDTLILCRNDLIISPVDLGSWWRDQFEISAVCIQTSIGRITIFSMYIAPNKNISYNSWLRIFSRISEHPHPLIYGDFNAHAPLWGYTNCNRNGTTITEMIDEYFLVLVNDETPTYNNQNSIYSSILDLIITTPTLSAITEFRVINASFSSDHHPIILQVQLTPTYHVSNSIRYNLSNVDWILFHSLMDEFSKGINNDLNENKETLSIEI